MAWHNPRSVLELAASIGRSWSFNSSRMRLRGNYVAVLSAPLDLEPETKHALTDKVKEGAELIRHNYMVEGTRERHPDAPVYYLSDMTTRRVVIAIYRNGAVEDELDILRPDLKQAARDKIREAVRSIDPDSLSY
jgi:hypothetical protein